MAIIPLFESEQRAPQAQGFALGTTSQVVASDGSAVGGALAAVGQQLSTIADMRKRARDATEVATATSEYLTKLHNAEREGVASNDFRVAPGEFRTRADAILKEATGKISDPIRRAQLSADLEARGLVSLGRV